MLFITTQTHTQVDLEPHGKIHLIVELKWHGKLHIIHISWLSATSSKSCKIQRTFGKLSTMKRFTGCFNSVTEQMETDSAVSSSKSAGGAEFKERNVAYTRRGAMRRRVHQVKKLHFLCDFSVVLLGRCWLIASNLSDFLPNN